jgi:hypothetical protein
MKPWLGKIDRSAVLRLASDPSTAPEVLHTIVAHGDPEFAASAKANPAYRES